MINGYRYCYCLALTHERVAVETKDYGLKGPGTTTFAFITLATFLSSDI